MAPTIALTVASLKMYFRNRQALFFSLFFPLLVMSIFPLLKLGTFSNVRVGIVDKAQNQLSLALIDSLNNTEILELSQDTLSKLETRLRNGKLDYLIVLPKIFGASSKPVKVIGLYNTNRLQETQVAETILAKKLDDLTFQLTTTSRIFELERQEILSQKFDYADFLVPGIVAMAIMQSGIFGVTFTLIQFRQQGVLRRLRATPIHPRQFLIGQITTRLIVSIVQTIILISFGILLLGIEVQGNYIDLLILAVIGGALFLSIGYAISGFARTEEVAAPVTNIITLPMIILSGVFFPRDNLPQMLEKITDFLPLTYLANGMRDITTEGAGLLEISEDVIGLSLWLLICFAAATRLFRWE